MKRFFLLLLLACITSSTSFAQKGRGGRQSPARRHATYQRHRSRHTAYRRPYRMYPRYVYPPYYYDPFYDPYYDYRPYGPGLGVTIGGPYAGIGFGVTL
jgi:hypothetical protein